MSRGIGLVGLDQVEVVMDAEAGRRTKGARVKTGVAAVRLDKTRGNGWAAQLVGRGEQKLGLDRKTEEVVTICRVEESSTGVSTMRPRALEG